MSVTSVPVADLLNDPSSREIVAPGNPIPAWLLSLMLHFGLVISGALLARSGTLTGMGEGEGMGERGGEIVLVANSNESDKPYLTEEDVGNTGSEEATPSEMEPSAEALPTNDSAPLIPGVGLPKAVAVKSGAAPGTTSAASATGAMSRPGRGVGKGGGTSTSVFGAIGEGQRFVYVFDRSSSMAGAALAAAKRELLTSVSHLGDIHQFGIVFYNHNQTVFGSASGGGTRLYFAKKDNRLLAERFVNETPAQGATNHLPALKMALEARPDVIFFLTDADDPVLTETELHKIKSWNVGCTINAIQFGYGPRQSFDNFLEQLTADNGGVYRYVDVTQLPRAK